MQEQALSTPEDMFASRNLQDKNNSSVCYLQAMKLNTSFINIIDDKATTVYFTVLKPATLCEAQYLTPTAWYMGRIQFSGKIIFELIFCQS